MSNSTIERDAGPITGSGTVTETSTHVAILMYHQVAARPHPAYRKYTVTPHAFAMQMAWLARSGYRAISLDDLTRHRDGGHDLPPRPVLITFDDGMQDCVEHAVPILARHGFTATFYLVAGMMGATSRWLPAERGVEFPLMSWSAARELESAGFRCGSHTMTHPRLATLAPEACLAELVGAKQLIEDGLGTEIRHLAYPFGSYDASVRELAAQAGYSTACTVRIGLSGPSDDLLALQRVPVTGDDSLLDFACRLRTGRTLKQSAQSGARRLLRRFKPRNAR
jgi:peptidoglycan/xylan/chitin deacetylase (PgdA/CDA1 family)